MADNLISYNIFKPFSGLTAFTTTRSAFPGNDMPRFSGKRTDSAENRKKLADILETDAFRLIFPKQTHTNCVREIYGAGDEEPDETDALISNKKGICLCVQTADCVPILMFDPKNMAIAVVHAGWRGTVNNIVGITVEKLKTSFGSLPSGILVAIGPSIGPDVYEVGDEVAEAVLKNVPNGKVALNKSETGKWHLNLWEANRQILLGCGVPDSNIEINGECTYQNPGKYFSARRQGIDTGRLVSGIMLK